MWLAFLITQLIETPLFCFLNKQEPLNNNIFAIVLTNTLTWPIATFLWNNSSISLLVIEIGVIIIETFIYSFIFGLEKNRAFIVSLVVNSASTLFGFLMCQYTNGKIF